MAKVATDFEKIIQDGRERKKNEALADRIFSKNRRQSAPSKLRAAPGPSLASRVGVKKRNSSTNLRPNLPPGNVNGEWTHDLHNAVNGNNARGGSLSSRITAPGSKRANKRAARLSAAVDRMDTSSDAPQQVNIVKKPANPMGLTIRGLAGPFTVLAQNFAPGTTAADIESAMTPVGGEMVSCRIIKTQPIIIVEMAFASREGGERVIETFNEKTADGRLIKVYPKLGGYQAPEKATPPPNAPSGPRGSRTSKNAANNNDNFVDGSMGFPDLMDTSTPNTNGSSSRSSQLYSDRLVNGNRRGRGNQRGRGNR
ncbi:hypothetical protein EDB81DRAFT_809822 [Dactylonectria macrodidyma]|uniref:RNA-binding protein n=1 Tax=Dactylonectria macrodidyma TaxID=307937 RepID=A0A9P9IPD7_9HYPO|nr:hypothetical protein EDB81DRAFT_809822 [Dactylonectria macrodidyma]